jgi:hypothetical protein
MYYTSDNLPNYARANTMLNLKQSKILFIEAPADVKRKTMISISQLVLS